MTNLTFNLTSWNFSVYGNTGILARQGRNLLTPLVRAELQRLIHASDLLNHIGGVSVVQENWCEYYANTFVELRKPSVDFAFSPFGNGITEIGNAIDSRLTPLSGGAAQKLRARVKRLTEPFRTKLPTFALKLEAASGRLAATLEPLTPELTNWIEKQTGLIVNMLGGENVGVSPPLLVRLAYEVFLDPLLARAVRNLLNPADVLGGGLTAMWPKEYTPANKPRPIFYPHPITSGTEIFAQKGFEEFEINVEDTPITVLTVHTHAISKETCKLQILNLIEHLRTLVEQGKRVVIAGDFNIAAERMNTYTGEPEATDGFQWLVERMEDIGMIEAYNSLNSWLRGQHQRHVQPSPTYDPTVPILPEPHRRKPHRAATKEEQSTRRQRLDFAFVGPGLRVEAIKVLEKECLIQVPNDSVYSIADHFPLHLKITIIPFPHGK